MSPIASDLSFEVLKLRARRGELGAQTLDATNQTLHPVVTRPSVFDGFVADRAVALDQAKRAEFVTER